jgi:predicted MFS family arabinose efflux permease
MGWTEAMSRVGTIVGFYLFPIVLAAAGLARTMLCLAVVPLLGLVALALIRWEPIGQDVETPDAEPVPN